MTCGSQICKGFLAQGVGLDYSCGMSSANMFVIFAVDLKYVLCATICGLCGFVGNPCCCFLSVEVKEGFSDFILVTGVSKSDCHIECM